MGNQSGKGSNGVPLTIEEVKRSKTNWTAGVPSPPGRPIVELSSRVTTPDENSVTDEISIVWTVPQDDGGFPITGYRVEMLDIQTGSWIEITFIEGYEPKCTLSNILYGIMYRFRVIALNDSGPSEPGEPSDPVVIDVPGVQIAPYFVHSLTDTIALEHEKIEFRVRVLGTPKPSIQWYKDDLELFGTERLELKEEDEGSWICLKGARLSDSGVIKCVASNLLGRAVTTAQLFIEAPPRFELPENYVDGLIFRQDEVIRLKIGIVAKPLAKIAWFFEDEPITQGSDLFIETSDTFTSLRIQGAKRWHCGEFRAYAENENGEDAVSILVTVTSPSSPPGRPVVIDITETKCTLRWDPSDDDGGADIKHYIVEYFRDVWDVWLKAQTTKECQVVIEDLIPGSRYKFRIKSENIYGISEASEESNPFDVGGVGNERASDNFASLIEPGIESSKTPKNKLLSETKRNWDSTSDDEENILERFLKVKKLNDLRVPSYDSDGLPSIVSVDMADDMSTSSGSQRNAQSSVENPPDMESVSEEDVGDYERARKLYQELQQISDETGMGSVDNFIENMHVSNESIASLIPQEKLQELNRFEMTLKEMIEEARQMADDAQKNEELRNKSASIQSVAETVIERPEAKTLPKISITQEENLSTGWTPHDQKTFNPFFNSRESHKKSAHHSESPSASVARYEEIISQRNNIGETSVLGDRGSSLPPTKDKTRILENGKRYSSSLMINNTPTPVQQRPLTLNNVKLHQKSMKKKEEPIPKDVDEQKPFEPKLIKVTVDPLRDENNEPFDEIKIPNQFPGWLLITSAYSAVLVSILLISNLMPEGKLFIHFTAFWSMLIYFFLDENT